MSYQLDGINNLEAPHLDLTSYSDLCFISALHVVAQTLEERKDSLRAYKLE